MLICLSITAADINSLRDVIEACEEIMPIARLAQVFFESNGRSMKIAVDEPDWRFHNVSPREVAEIRKGTLRDLNIYGQDEY
jgi:hypothetical protein